MTGIFQAFQSFGGDHTSGYSPQTGFPGDHGFFAANCAIL